MKRGLRWGMQFGVPVTAELLTVCVGIRGDAGQVNQCVLCRGEHFEMFQKKIKGVTTCHNLIVTLDVTHFVNSSSLMRNKWYDMARTMRLDKLCATKTAGLGTPYISHQCEACLRQMRSWTKFHVNLRFRLQSSYKYSKTFTTTFH